MIEMIVGIDKIVNHTMTGMIFVREDRYNRNQMSNRDHG